MEMKDILRRIDLRIAQLGTTDAAISRRATGSSDTIRNWRRREASGKSPGASTATIEPVANALGVPIEWLIGGGPDDLDQFIAERLERETFISLYDSLSSDRQAIARAQVAALKPSRSEPPASSPPKKGD